MKNIDMKRNIKLFEESLIDKLNMITDKVLELRDKGLIPQEDVTPFLKLANYITCNNKITIIDLKDICKN